MVGGLLDAVHQVQHCEAAPETDTLTRPAANVTSNGWLEATVRRLVVQSLNEVRNFRGFCNNMHLSPQERQEAESRQVDFCSV